MAEPGLLISRPEPLHHTRLLLTEGQFGGDKGEMWSLFDAGECDIMIFKSNIYLIFLLFLGQSSAVLRISKDERNTRVFCYIIEVTLGKCLGSLKDGGWSPEEATTRN